MSFFGLVSDSMTSFFVLFLGVKFSTTIYLSGNFRETATFFEFVIRVDYLSVKLQGRDSSRQAVPFAPVTVSSDWREEERQLGQDASQDPERAFHYEAVQIALNRGRQRHTSSE